MSTDRFCIEDELGLHAHYVVPRGTYLKLQALALVMDESKETAPLATTLRSLLAQIVCVLHDQ